MIEFGQNGEVLTPPSDMPRPYQGAYGQQKLVKRVPLAIFLCALFSSLLVGLSGFLGIAITETIIDSSGLRRTGFVEGIEIAFFISALNWVLFFVTIPVTTLVLGLSIGRFPSKRIVKSKPYYRWGAIWGAILVAGTTTIFGLQGGIMGALGGLVVGLAIGISSGLACAGLFLAIVKPRQQLGDATVDVF